MMKTGVTAGEAMTSRPIYVTPNTTLAECASIMKESHVGSLLVKEDQNLVGIITEQDIVRRAVAEHKNPGDMTADKIMAKHVYSVEPGADIFEALREMKDYNIRHLPVMQDGQLLGLITGKDILKIAPHLFEMLVDKIELREEDKKPINKFSENEGLCQNCGEYSDALKIIGDQLICSNCE